MALLFEFRHNILVTLGWLLVWMNFINRGLFLKDTVLLICSLNRSHLCMKNYWLRFSCVMHYTNSADKLSCCFSMFIKLFMMWNISEPVNSCIAVYSPLIVILDLFRYKNYLWLKKKEYMFLLIIYLPTCFDNNAKYYVEFWVFFFSLCSYEDHIELLAVDE